MDRLQEFEARSIANDDSYSLADRIKRLTEIEQAARGISSSDKDQGPSDTNMGFLRRTIGRLAGGLQQQGTPGL